MRVGLDGPEAYLKTKFIAKSWTLATLCLVTCVCLLSCNLALANLTEVDALHELTEIGDTAGIRIAQATRPDFFRNRCVMTYEATVDIKDCKSQTAFARAEVICYVREEPVKSVFLINIFGKLPALKYSEHGQISAHGENLDIDSFIEAILQSQPTIPSDLYLSSSATFVENRGEDRIVRTQWTNRFLTVKGVNNIQVTITEGGELWQRPVYDFSGANNIRRKVIAFGTSIGFTDWSFTEVGSGMIYKKPWAPSALPSCSSRWISAEVSATETGVLPNNRPADDYSAYILGSHPPPDDIYLCRPLDSSGSRPVPYPSTCEE